MACILLKLNSKLKLDKIHLLKKNLHIYSNRGLTSRFVSPARDYFIRYIVNTGCYKENCYVTQAAELPEDVKQHSRQSNQMVLEKKPFERPSFQ